MLMQSQFFGLFYRDEMCALEASKHIILPRLRACVSKHVQKAVNVHYATPFPLLLKRCYHSWRSLYYPSQCEHAAQRVGGYKLLSRVCGHSTLRLSSCWQRIVMTLNLSTTMLSAKAIQLPACLTCGVWLMRRKIKSDRKAITWAVFSKCEVLFLFLATMHSPVRSRHDSLQRQIIELISAHWASLHDVKKEKNNLIAIFARFGRKCIYNELLIQRPLFAALSSTL